MIKLGCSTVQMFLLWTCFIVNTIKNSVSNAYGGVTDRVSSAGDGYNFAYAAAFAAGAFKWFIPVNAIFFLYRKSE